jgi:N4-gp56 family major capsid protein
MTFTHNNNDICFLHPHQAKALRKDSAWINASNYGAPDQIFLGEIGRIEDVRFIETTQCRKILHTDGSIYTDNEDTGVDTTYSTTADVYSAIIVGDHTMGLAISLEAELRDNGVQDAGRRHSIAYYGIWGTGLIESAHGLVLESA